MHLDDERIQRLLHGELDARALADASSHLAGCRACRSRLEADAYEEERIFELLHRLDHAPPRLDAESVIAGARRPRIDYRWVAGIVLALGAAGAAYAVPGSPLPGWVERVVERLGPIGGGTEATGAGTPVEAGPSGIAVTPGERLTLVFETGEAGGVVIVTLTDGSNVVVRSDAGAATFTTGANRLTVTSRGAARFEIELPRSARWVEVRGAGRQLLLKTGTGIVGADSIDERGRYVVPLSSADRSRSRW